MQVSLYVNFISEQNLYFFNNMKNLKLRKIKINISLICIKNMTKKMINKNQVSKIGSIIIE